MADGGALRVILAGCERLRRIPEGRWYRPPEPPLGTRPPQSRPEHSGDTLEVVVGRAITAIMAADARGRGVSTFRPGVSVFGLADVLSALARSLAEHEPDAIELQHAAAAAAEW